jgi:hypothetical protein
MTQGGYCKAAGLLQKLPAGISSIHGAPFCLHPLSILLRSKTAGILDAAPLYGILIG